MIGSDVSFPFRLRYAADILNEVNEYEGYVRGTHIGYTAEELNNIADEYETKERLHEAELKELVDLIQLIGGSGAWTLNKAKEAAQSIISSGYHKFPATTK